MLNQVQHDVFCDFRLFTNPSFFHFSIFPSFHSSTHPFFRYFSIPLFLPSIPPAFLIHVLTSQEPVTCTPYGVLIAILQACQFTPLEIMPRSVSSRNDWNF